MLHGRCLLGHRRERGVLALDVAQLRASADEACLVEAVDVSGDLLAFRLGDSFTVAALDQEAGAVPAENLIDFGVVVHPFLGFPGRDPGDEHEEQHTHSEITKLHDPFSSAIGADIDPQICSTLLLYYSIINPKNQVPKSAISGAFLRV